MLSDQPRKNCRTIAEWAGEARPDGMQHLLSRAKWDADRVRDDVRQYVVEHLHDPEAVLVVHETGDVKKGTRTVERSDDLDGRFRRAGAGGGSLRRSHRPPLPGPGQRRPAGLSGVRGRQRRS